MVLCEVLLISLHEELLKETRCGLTCLESQQKMAQCTQEAVKTFHYPEN